MYAVWSIVLISIVQIRGGEICCDGIGCFTDDYPYDHYPLPRCPDTIPTIHQLFTRNNRNDPEVFDVNSVPTNFVPSRRTVFIIHGYFNDESTNWIPSMKDAFLDQEDMNVIVVGWGGVYDYITAASTVRTVGAQAAVIVDNLVNSGASYGNMWCVGHSLGAHACANVGMNTGQKMARITGLDPAGPWFENYDHSTGINPSVANFVDIIHTMAHSPIVNYGLVRPAGHMDFYPNGGDNLQPGCLTYYDEKNSGSTKDDEYSVACSHSRAVSYFEESISNDCYIARETCSGPNGMPDNCSECNGGGECARMGFRAQGSGPDGVYYLETNSEPEFCRN